MIWVGVSKDQNASRKVGSGDHTVFGKNRIILGIDWRPFTVYSKTEFMNFLLHPGNLKEAE